MGEVEERAARTGKYLLRTSEHIVGLAGGDGVVYILVDKDADTDDLAYINEIDGVPTQVWEVGRPKALLKPGDSIGDEFATGTLGGFVTDEDDGTLYALTNQHVAAGGNAAPLGEIVSPGPADGEGERIGYLSRYEPIVPFQEMLVDAALVYLESEPDPEPDYMHPATARTGWSLNGRGRTSGEMEGEVYARGATVDVDMGSLGVVTFTEQVLTSPMLQPGDSGSVLRSENGHPCLLGFAGSHDVSIANPLWTVLRRLNVQWDA